MTKLKLGALEEDKPVKISLELPGPLYRRLAAYAEALGRQEGQTISDPGRLIAPMLDRFMATDRGFAGTRKKA